MQENKIKTIGVLTSGGDAPGMNAAIRAVTRYGIIQGFRVVGIRRGYKGLLERDIQGLNLRTVSNILQQGGTMLYTSRCPEFMEHRCVVQAADICREEGIDALVTIGGDGTYRGALELSREGINCIGIPGTIDNDISSSDYTIGFDTAVNTVVQMVDRVRDTARSHDRCSVVEVMGRHAGYIAVEAGIACGALCVLVPEIPYDLQHDVVERMMEALNNGKQHFIIMVAEGAGHAPEIATQIREMTRIETNHVVLGYVQRGGSPTSMDRVMASRMGYHAVDLIAAGQRNRVVGRQHGEVVDFDIAEGLAMKKTIDMSMIRVADSISI
jgi:6-phosphofructokinase 1